MPVTVEKVQDDPIIIATTLSPFAPSADMPAMFGEITRHRMSINGPSALIIDCSNTMDSFNVMMTAMAEASQAIKKSRESVGQAPILIFVGTGLLAEIAAKSMGQSQYGGVSGELRPTREEAIAIAREKLTAAMKNASLPVTTADNHPGPGSL